MPGGRPTVIDAPLRELDDGTIVTVAERILSSMRAGNYLETACASAGVAKQTVYGWLRIAARIRLKHHGGDDFDRSTLDAHELRCLQFSDAVEEADADWEVAQNLMLERMSRGDIKVTHTTVKVDGNGQTIETVTKTETIAPNAQVILWRLTRRHPDRYGNRVEMTGAGGGPIAFSQEERAANLVETFAAYLEGVDDANAAPAPKRRKRPTP